MFKPIVCKAKTNITIPYSGTKKEKLEFIDRTARTFCENFDTYLQINNQKNFIKKKELIALFSELFPGLKINIGRVSSKEAGTDAATRREEDCYIMRLKPLKSKNMLVNILDYFRPLKIEKNPDNIEYLKNLGCVVYYIGYKKNKILKQLYCINNLYNLLKEHQYDCVHIHADVANKLLVPGIACNIARVKKIILHSHASSVDGKKRWMKYIYHWICRNLLKYTATDFVSCSDLASQWMFPNIDAHRVKKINNGVRLNQFRFNTVIRQEVRNRLGIRDCFVIGHVGRFAYQKNHEYLIDVFAKVKKIVPSAILLLVGEGDLRNVVEQKVISLGLINDVIFYGISYNVSELFQAMDVFLLPSHFEGLPIVGVEAQAAGLPVLFSSAITKEAKLINEVYYLPVDERSKDMWVKQIVELQRHRRYDTYSELERCGFDIHQTVEELMNLYKI